MHDHFKSTWQVADCCCEEIGHQNMTNPYYVYEKSTWQKVSQTGGRDSGGDFASSFGCESCFSSETRSLCLAESRSVPKMVAIMSFHIRLAKPNHRWHCTRQAFRLELKIADISVGLDMYWSPVLPSPSQVQHWLCSSQINKIKIPNHFRAGWKWSDSSLSVI